MALISVPVATAVGAPMLVWFLEGVVIVEALVIVVLIMLFLDLRELRK